MKPASDIDPDDFDNGIPDEMFEKIIALIRIAVPYTGMIISTRESQAGARGGASAGRLADLRRQPHQRGRLRGRDAPHDTEQFDVSDTRTLDEVIGWLMDEGHLPPASALPATAPAAPATASWSSARAARSRTSASRTPCSRWESTCATTPALAVAEKGWKMIDTELAPRSRRPPPRYRPPTTSPRVRTGERDFRF